MKGYSKIKGNNPFIPISQSNKEFLFLDKDYDLVASKSINKQTHWIHEHQEPRIIHEAHSIKKDDAFFLGKTDDYDGDQGEKSNSKGGVLKRNVSLSSSKTTTNSSYNNKNFSLERQSSTRAIQEAVKRAFSIKRSSSVNSDRYSRIHDQPCSLNVDDFDHNCDYAYDNDHNHDDDVANYGNQGYDFERLETRSMKKNTDNHGRRHVGSKVVRACKRLFSR